MKLSFAFKKLILKLKMYITKRSEWKGRGKTDNTKERNSNEFLKFKQDLAFFLNPI